MLKLPMVSPQYWQGGSPGGGVLEGVLVVPGSAGCWSGGWHRHRHLGHHHHRLQARLFVPNSMWHRPDLAPVPVVEGVEWAGEPSWGHTRGQVVPGHLGHPEDRERPGRSLPVGGAPVVTEPVVVVVLGVEQTWVIDW